MGVQVTKKLANYGSGVLRDDTCQDMSTNHAVVAMAYTPDWVLIKNSWGVDWGEKGFIRLARNHHNCGMWVTSYYPKLDTTGVTDTGPNDEAAIYDVVE